MGEMQLLPTEESYLRAWLWECAHIRRDGKAHQLAVANGINGKDVVHIVESTFPALSVDESVFGDAPMAGEEWPWPGQSLHEICASLRARFAPRVMSK